MKERISVNKKLSSNIIDTNIYGVVSFFWLKPLLKVPSHFGMLLSHFKSALLLLLLLLF